MFIPLATVQLLPVDLPQCGFSELLQIATHRWHSCGLERLGLTGNGMAVEDRPCRAQESGLQEVLSSRPCWASRSVLSTHSSSALARLFPQSPPKLNEANSDTSRETTHAQSGSESSSQEAAPKKGRNSPACTLGETPDFQLGTAVAVIDLRDWPEVPMMGSGWPCPADMCFFSWLPTVVQSP